MDRFLASLAAAIAWNQRTIIIALIRQVLLIVATGVALTKLSGAWWCLCLAACVGCALWGVFLAFAFKWQSEIELKPPWRAVTLDDYAKSEPLALALHLIAGGTQVIRVPRNLVAEVIAAGREAGIEIVTEDQAQRAVNAKSIRLGRIRDIEELVPSVPTVELRDELTSTLSRLKVVEVPGGDDLLFALRRDLEAEKKAQKKTPLSSPIHEKEIREKLAAFAKLLA